MWLSNVGSRRVRLLVHVVASASASVHDRRLLGQGIENAKLYQSAHELQRRDNKMILDFYKNALGRNHGSSGQTQVLDIGCGSGDSTRELLLPLAMERLGAKRVVATDISPAMVEFARDSFPHRSICYDVFDVSSADATESLLSKYGHYDVVFSLYALHWVRDLGRALRNIRRLLRPPQVPTGDGTSKLSVGGAVTSPTCNTSECLLAFLALNPALLVYRDLCSTSKWAEYFDASDIPFGELYSQKVLEELAVASGLKLRSCEVLGLEFRYASTENLKESAVAICPFYQLIPASLVDEFERDLVDAYLRLSKGANVFNYQLAVLHGFPQ